MPDPPGWRAPPARRTTSTTCPTASSRHGDEPARVGVRIGDHVVDLAPVAAADMLEVGHVFEAPSLNPLLALGRRPGPRCATWLDRPAHRRDRARPGRAAPGAGRRGRRCGCRSRSRDYVDFYCSLRPRHQRRPDLPPRRRAAEARTGGTCRSATTAAPARWWSPAPTCAARSGQRKRARATTAPTYGPSTPARHRGRARLRGRRRRPGSASRSPTAAFADHVFGVTLLNDWSARDIQAWEYVPLGPVPRQVVRHLGQRLGHPARGARRRPRRPARPGPRAAGLPARRTSRAGLDIDIEVVLNGETVSRPPYASMYWSPAQMLAHLTVNGASLRTGDLFASGTVSGPERDQRGSFLELSWGGQEPFGDGADVPRGRRHRHAAGHRARRRRRPDRARRGHRHDHARYRLSRARPASAASASRPAAARHRSGPARRGSRRPSPPSTPASAGSAGW